MCSVVPYPHCLFFNCLFSSVTSFKELGALLGISPQKVRLCRFSTFNFHDVYPLAVR